MQSQINTNIFKFLLQSRFKQVKKKDKYNKIIHNHLIKKNATNNQTIHLYILFQSPFGCPPDK